MQTESEEQRKRNPGRGIVSAEALGIDQSRAHLAGSEMGGRKGWGHAQECGPESKDIKEPRRVLSWKVQKRFPEGCHNVTRQNVPGRGTRQPYRGGSSRRAQAGGQGHGHQLETESVL